MTQQLNVLVTGASSGIGRATALEFARRGHQVFAAARREQALATLTTATPNIRAVTLDVTDADSVEQAWAKISASTGGSGVDVLVNNAGFALSGPIEVLADADVRRQFATNVFGLLTMTRTVLPSMRARGSGRVIISEPGFVATSLGEAADALPAGQQEAPGAYAEMMARGTRYLAAQIAKGIAPERVAAAIVNAAEHPSPRPRYVVPGSARPLIALLTTLPARLSDRVKQRAIASA